MVARGQYLERPTLVPVGREVMEAMSHRGERAPPLLVLPPQPEEGGSMDHVLAAELAFAGARAGHPTLRFNHRGVGASQGKRGRGTSLVDDAEAALRVLRENADASAVAVAALHGGARTALALQARERAVGGLVLVAPVGLALEEIARLRVPLLVVTGQGDRQLSRPALAEAVGEARGTLELIEEAEASLHAHLPQVGRAVARWLAHLSGGGSQGDGT